MDDAVEVDEALLPEAFALLDVRAELAVPVAVDAEFVLVGPAVTVTGRNVISVWARVDADVPGKLAPVPLIISVQVAVVVPPIEQTTRPQLSVIVSSSHILREIEEGGEDVQSFLRLTHCPFYGLGS